MRIMRPEFGAQALHPRDVGGELRGVRAAGLRRLPAREPRFLDGDGERLVERRIVLHVDDLVRELVEDEPGDLRVPVADEGRQHGVVEISECRIGRHSADVDIVALGREARRLGARVGFGEIAPIGDAPGDRKAPLPRRQRQLRRREHVPHHVRRARRRRIACSCGLSGSASSRLANARISLHARELRLERGIRRVPSDLGDRTRAREKIDLPREALPVELDRRAAGERQQDGKRCDASDRAQAHQRNRVTTLAGGRRRRARLHRSTYSRLG